VDWPIVRALGQQRYLALSLLAYLGVVPFTVDYPVTGRLFNYGVLALVFITGPLAVARTRGTLAFTFILALLVLLPGVASTIANYDVAYPFSLGVGIVFFSFLAGLITRELLIDDSSVDSETIWAAVNVYVLIGLCFAFWYAALAYYEPDLFVGKFMDDSFRNQLVGFFYFSFVTLTTLGYGDITPNTTGVATLAYPDALIGQLYLAIMIARLVGLYVARRE
jgi:hypothetical protein